MPLAGDASTVSVDVDFEEEGFVPVDRAVEPLPFQVLRPTLVVVVFIPAKCVAAKALASQLVLERDFRDQQRGIVVVPPFDDKRTRIGPEPKPVTQEPVGLGN